MRRGVKHGEQTLKERGDRANKKDGPGTAEGPTEKNVIFTLRNVLFRGFLEEEEDWKKSEEMERTGRV
jgi:hypothetical protein